MIGRPIFFPGKDSAKENPWVLFSTAFPMSFLLKSVLPFGGVAGACVVVHMIADPKL